MPRHCGERPGGGQATSKPPAGRLGQLPRPRLEPGEGAGRKYLPKGAGAILGFGIKGGLEAGQKFIDSLEAGLAPGQRRRRQDPGHPPGDHDAPAALGEEQLATGVTPDFIRLSIGIEHVDDILADIDQALQKAAQ